MLKKGLLNGNIEIEKILPKNKVIRSVDKLMFGEAVYNLLDNAGKYSRSVKQPKVRITLEEVENKAVLRVWDNGIGIPEKYQKNIFDRFCRIDKSRSKKTGGFGLGLAIVKKIVEDHGGEIHLRSRKGDTEFTIIIN